MQTGTSICKPGAHALTGMALRPVRGQFVRWASRLLHHGGSAFPGKVVERFDPTFLSRTAEHIAARRGAVCLRYERQDHHHPHGRHDA